MIDEQVVEKIQKILRLAHCKGATQGEVEAAMQRAKEIAMKHQINLATISLEDPNEKRGIQIQTDKQEAVLRSKKEQLYHLEIYQIFRSVFGVRTIRFRGWNGDSIMLLGEVTDVMICKELMPWLEDVYYSTYYNAKKSGLIYGTRADKRGIYEGLTVGIRSVNKKAEDRLEKKEAQTYALVVRKKQEVVDAFVKQEFPDLRSVKQRPVEVNARALGIGIAKGKTINLQHVGNGGANKQIGQ